VTAFTPADLAELDVLVHTLGEYFNHRTDCADCRAAVLPCPRVQNAIAVVTEWVDARRLLLAAEELRLERAAQLAALPPSTGGPDRAAPRRPTLARRRTEPMSRNVTAEREPDSLHALAEVPHYPVDVLPEAVRDVVTAGARDGLPAALLGGAALAALAAAVTHADLMLVLGVVPEKSWKRVRAGATSSNGPCARGGVSTIR